jgi:hypothetical protein
MIGFLGVNLTLEFRDVRDIDSGRRLILITLLKVILIGIACALFKSLGVTAFVWPSLSSFGWGK